MFFDIETSPNVVYSWRIGQKVNLTTDNIIEERRIICICWKYLGEDTTYYLTWDKNQNDKEMLREFGKELESADVAIGHNGDAFDLKWVKTRNLMHKLPPLTNITTIDTLKLSRRYFNFNSNKLDYLGEALGLGRKTETGGYSLWLGCLDNDKKSLDKMVDYCCNDVVLLENVYKQLLPYVDRTNFHAGYHMTGDLNSCPSCGSCATIKYGHVRTRTGIFTKRQCKDCGHVFKSSKKES